MARRKKLARFGEVRLRFRATFAGWGTKRGHRGVYVRTLLLTNVRRVDTDQVVTDHVWFTHTRRWLALGKLSENEEVEFDARVWRYRGGHKLAYPTKICLCTSREEKRGQLARFGVVVSKDRGKE